MARKTVRRFLLMSAKNRSLHNRIMLAAYAEQAERLLKPLNEHPDAENVIRVRRIIELIQQADILRRSLYPLWATDYEKRTKAGGPVLPPSEYESDPALEPRKR